MKDFIINLLATLLGRRASHRLGRSLYLNARKDTPNEMNTNGEQLIQKQLIKKFGGINEKPVVFDVGANVGEWTEYLLDEVHFQNNSLNIEIHAFEPVTSTYNTLRSRILKHQLGLCVHFINLALSNENGVDKIFITGEKAGTNSLHRDESNQDLPTLQIEKTTAYDYCQKANINTIHFLKIDTEGHDVEVLKGAIRLFKEEKIHVCQFEYNFRWIYSKHFLKDVFDLLKGLPYQIGKITKNKIQFYEKWHPELERFFEGNYLIVYNNDISWFEHESGSFDRYYIYSHKNAVNN
jgi:FkbM family methyltransferase